ncbi:MULTISPECIES: DUF308 domain-containing protein [unclassified Caballeronia]|uniref:DUF308 domain-containing protein n=1 Tax=unclassified Caballeronia TaxID=2646786 RepID=UPI0028679FC1|nr:MULTISPECIES: DUF308 domain-containing protein [unclassified Caballeronia]MDR5815610.1 DUF308 domain-containing protein [Caballeronia sp. LZ033]MDR5822183.1 DUF308 domain-containing protein [Caballeronia sp. LZ043]MDR5880340.1 DUF308 domain-containing protein [Caballeronia sp. LZ032]
MAEHRVTQGLQAAAEQWLKHYYFTRAAVSIIWVALAFAVGMHSTVGAAILLVLYPAWDALANYLDLSRSGGKTDNRTQAINVAISAATTAAVIIALKTDPAWVLGVFGVWAILSGLLQLGTALRRWKQSGAQWAMILSGAQSAVAGCLFLTLAPTPLLAAIARIAGYAGVGAAYFLISAVWLSVGQFRRSRARVS